MPASLEVEQEKEKQKEKDDSDDDDEVFHDRNLEQWSDHRRSRLVPVTYQPFARF